MKASQKLQLHMVFLWMEPHEDDGTIIFFFFLETVDWNFSSVISPSTDRKEKFFGYKKCVAIHSSLFG